jgi:replicative DNA helicase
MDSKVLLELSLQPGDFTERNGVIWAAILALSDAGDDIDEITVCSRLRMDGTLNTVGGTPYIATMADYTGAAEAYPTYAKLVKVASRNRELVRIGKEMAAKASSNTADPNEIAANAEAHLIRLYDQQAGQLVDSNIAMRDVFGELSHTFKHGREAGVLTGFTDLDAMTGGFHAGHLTVIAGRPGTGKTALACCAGLNAALGVGDVEPKNVAIFSLEMFRTELIYRLLSGQSRVPHRDLVTANINIVQWKDITKGAERIAKAKLWVCDKADINPSEIRLLCKQQSNRHGLDMVIVDYLQLMKLGTRVNSQEEEISEISRQLKLLAKDLEIPVVALAQLNRMSENRADKRPMISDLRGSGAIEQDADFIVLLYREEMHNPHDPSVKGKVEAIIGKNRHGETGVVQLSAQLQYFLFTDLDSKYGGGYERG